MLKILQLPLISLILFLLPEFSLAQNINVDFGEDSASTSQVVRLIGIITILTLAPSILVMVTSFTRIVVVLSLLRSAIGIQQTPPNSVLISLALFLTMFIMTPVFNEAYEEGLRPLLDEEISESEAFEKIGKPFHTFMSTHAREKDVMLFVEIAEASNNEEMKLESPDDIPFRVLIPAFMISELRRAFEIGFLIFVPFLIIDMLVASTLMSMGMMMLPPVIISLPFKLIFFVLVDGWYMLSSSLIKSFGL